MLNYNKYKHKLININMSASAFVQLPYGIIENQPAFKFKNQKNYETNNYLKTLPYLDNVERPEIQNDAINLIKNKASFRNYLLATSDVGTSLQDAINHIVTDGEFNDVGLRRVLDSHNSDIFKVSNPLSLVFKNAHTYNLKNPILGNLVSQIYAGGLSDENIRNLLLKGDIQNIQTRLDNLKRKPLGNNNKNNNDNDDDDNDGGNPDVFLPDVPVFEPGNNNVKIDRNIQREHPKQIAPRESLKTASTTSFAESLPQIKARVKDGLNFNTDFEVDGNDSEPKFEKFSDLGEDYQVSFDKPITILKEDGVVEIQPEINFEPDINPIVKDELKNDENPKGYHKFKDIDVSNSLKLFFPKLIEEKPSSEELFEKKPNEVELNDEDLLGIIDSGFLTDNISKINETFFIGGNNFNFEREASRFRNQSNEMFINFLQSNLALELMKENKIKIHISSGDIYVSNINTNESIYDFLAAQDNENYIIIDKEFIFDGTLTEYYNTYLTDNSLSIEDDFTTNRNSKFLYLHFNNVLQMTGVPTYRLRHTVVIKNEKSIELMQKSNWQYFIETLMDHAEDNLLHSTSEYTDEEQETIRPYLDKLISHGEMYKDIYSSIALSFHNVFENLPNEQFTTIFKDLQDNNVHLAQLFDGISPEQLLNIFLDFYYFNGRFPGDSNLIVLPSFDVPKEINNSIIDFKELFFRFKNTYFEGLTSIQGICALSKYVSKNSKSIDISIKNTIEELLSNLTEQNLHYYKGKISYDNIINLMNLTIENLNDINNDINRQREIVTEQVNKEINKYKNEQKIEEIIDPEIALLPIDTDRKIEKNEDYINELEKFLVQIEPTVDGFKQIKSENEEKLILDVENPLVKIEDSLNEIERTADENEKITFYDLPKTEPLTTESFDLPNLNENIDGINSNNNIIKYDNEDDFITNIKEENKDFIPEPIPKAEPIKFDLTEVGDELSIDLDQDEENVKLKLDNDLFDNDFEIKYEKTEPGFLPDFPNKNNLGEQIIQIDIDNNDIDNTNIKQEEMDTNYERPIVVLPTSHLNNLRKRKLKRENDNKAKIRKLASKPITKKIKQEMLDRYYAERPDFNYELNNVEFLKQVPVHPRNRKNRKIKKEIDEQDVEFLKQVPVHPRDRKNRKIKKEIDEKPVVVLPTSHSANLRKQKRKTKKKTNIISKKTKQEMLDKYYSDQNENVKFIGQKSLHPRYRKIKSQPKIKIDKSAKNYLKISDFDIKFNSIQGLSRNDRTERIMDILISKFPPDNNEYSIKYDSQTDTFTIYRDE